MFPNDEEGKGKWIKNDDIVRRGYKHKALILHVPIIGSLRKRVRDVCTKWSIKT
jgi:hypothetical protein